MASLQSDRMKYVIAIHGIRNDKKFLLPRTANGKDINIKYASSQTSPGNTFRDITGNIKSTGNCLMVGRVTVNNVCDSNFKYVHKVKSGEDAYDIRFTTGYNFPELMMGIYSCLSIDGETVVPMNLVLKLCNEYTEIQKKYDTLEKVTKIIIDIHDKSKYRDYPIDIVPLTCSLASDWLGRDLPLTKTNFLDITVKDDLEDITAKLGNLHVTPPPPFRKRKRTSRPSNRNTKRTRISNRNRKRKRTSRPSNRRTKRTRVSRENLTPPTPEDRSPTRKRKR
jgi:hypothetical protein